MYNVATNRTSKPAVSVGPARAPALRAVDGAQHGQLPPVPLDFARDALLPHVSPATMGFHYDKHYLGYLKKANAMLAGTDLAGLPLEEIIRRAAKGRKRALLANAAQAWNHGFFWKCLSPAGSTTLAPLLARAISRSFGSIEAFRDRFIARGVAHLGSGWLWLSHEPGRADGENLVITATRDATPVWLGGKRMPLLVCDLWEHAYYLDWKNDRAGFLNGFIHDLANWDFASSQFAAATGRQAGWAYPLAR